MKLLSFLSVIVIASFCVTAPARTEHPHAKILGALIYTDLSITADGFKSRFSTKASLQLIQYPITDLLFTIRDFDEAPIMDTGGNSGSGNGPSINFGSGGSDPKKQSKDTRIDKIIQLITKFIEPEQWDINGGECSIDSFRDTLLINAPDYVHRQIGGYPYEPIRPSSVRARRVDYSKGRTTVQVPPSIQ
jgi:hypothetical protein